MVINILAFGIVKEIFGSSVASIELPEASTVAQLIATIKDKYPTTKNLSSFAIAVNGAYATSETILKQSDEIAIIPPVSGG